MEENKEHIIAQWLEGAVSDESLNSHYDVKMSSDLSRIRDAADQLVVPEVDSRVLLEKIRAEVARPKPAKVRSLKYWMSAVAALFIALLAYTALLDEGVQVDNDTLQYVTHSLPDGSIIKLNANSKIDYDSDFIQNRKLNLLGEAFFEVKKGETFVVQTNNGDITVLGTSFNVFSRENSFNVACKTGKVKVSTDKEYILNPGDNVVLLDGTILKEGQIDIQQIGTWQQGESKFISSPFSEVILAMEAQYDVEVHGQNMDGNQKFTGSFVHNDLDKAARMVFLPMGVSYELDKKNKVIIIQ